MPLSAALLRGARSRGARARGAQRPETVATGMHLAAGPSEPA